MDGPYRGSENAQAEAAVNREIDKIKRDIAAKRKERVSLTQLKTAWKPFSVCLGMMFLLQFSALNVIVYYSVSIFQLSAISIDPNVAFIIVGVLCGGLDGGLQVGIVKIQDSYFQNSYFRACTILLLGVVHKLLTLTRFCLFFDHLSTPLR